MSDTPPESGQERTAPSDPECAPAKSGRKPTGRPRRPRAARQAWEVREELDARYLDHYVRDPEFGRALLELSKAGHIPKPRYQDPSPPATADVPSPTGDAGQREGRPRDARVASPSYILAVKELAARFGLDRFRPTGPDPFAPGLASQGEQLIDIWLRMRASASEADGDRAAAESAAGGSAEGLGPDRSGEPPSGTDAGGHGDRRDLRAPVRGSLRVRGLEGTGDWPLARFPHGIRFMGPRPSIGRWGRLELPAGHWAWTKVEAPDHAEYGLDGIRMYGEWMPVAGVEVAPGPLVRVAFEAQWDPRAEPIESARRRLLAEAARQIDRELALLADEAEAKGYRFRSHDEADRAIRWLFWKVRHRLSYGRIAQRWEREHPGDLRRRRRGEREGDPGDDAELVKKAVVRMAERIGIDRKVR